MKEVKLLLEKSKKSLSSAELLFDKKYYDASVSRAYYAMFYSTEAILLTKNVKFSSHKSVISLFNKEFIATGIFEKELGKSLSSAFEKRLLGDYGYQSEIDRNTAEVLICEAGRFLLKIEKYLKESDYLI